MPSTIVDITSYSGTGYVGDSTHDIIRSLYKKCKSGGTVRVRKIITDSYKLAVPSHSSMSSSPTDEMLADFVVESCLRGGVAPPPNMAEFLNADVSRDPKKDSSYGVVFVDEIDKVSSYSPHGTQKGVISSREVQNNLLRIIEDSEIEIKETSPSGREGGNSFMEKLNGGGGGNFVSTRNILFIFSGAFHDMNDYLAGKDANKGKGVNGSYLGLARTEDYVKTGFSQEFMGRVPTRIDLLPLTKDDLKNILFLTSSSNSVLRREMESFRSFGLQLHLTDCGAEEIASRCYQDKTGARGLGGMLESVLRDFKFELGGRFSDRVIDVIIDSEVVKDPKAGLDSVLESLNEK